MGWLQQNDAEKHKKNRVLIRNEDIMNTLCPVEKNKEYLMTIDDIGNDGEGIGKIDGFTVFVKDALPGEKINVLITKVKKNFAYGRLMKIIEVSENRVQLSISNLHSEHHTPY